MESLNFRRKTSKEERMGTALIGAFHTMRTNMRDPVRRKNVAVLMAGKAIGLSIVVALMLFVIPQAAHAQDGSDTDPIMRRGARPERARSSSLTSVIS